MLVDCLGFFVYISIGVLLSIILVLWLKSRLEYKDGAEINWLATIFCIPFWPIALGVLLCLVIYVAIDNWKEKHSKS